MDERDEMLLVSTCDVIATLGPMNPTRAVLLALEAKANALASLCRTALDGGSTID